MRHHHIYTPLDLIAALGGTSATARFFGVSPAAVNHWQTRGNHLPASRYIEQMEMLKKAGIAADIGIWFSKLRKTPDGKQLVDGAGEA